MNHRRTPSSYVGVPSRAQMPLARPMSPSHIATPLHQTAYHLGPNRRAMVSLGPLKPRNYCTFTCPFCYVRGPFPRYQAGAAVDEIVAWLQSRRSRFDIVYISGDTDSFAPPRTAQALELLAALRQLQCDVLFTTRHRFARQHRELLASLAADYHSDGYMLIGCVSVSQLRQPGLEPRPIASPQARLEQVAWMRSAGLVSVLTVRPFIPAVPAEEYADIVHAGAAGCDVVLGSHWYVDPAGVILEQTSRALGHLAGGAAHRMPLDFSDDSTSWQVHEHPEAEAAVRQASATHGRPFFMRSDPAIAYLRARRA